MTNCRGLAGADGHCSDLRCGIRGSAGGEEAVHDSDAASLVFRNLVISLIDLTENQCVTVQSDGVFDGS